VQSALIQALALLVIQIMCSTQESVRPAQTGTITRLLLVEHALLAQIQTATPAHPLPALHALQTSPQILPQAYVKSVPLDIIILHQVRHV